MNTKQGLPIKLIPTRTKNFIDELQQQFHGKTIIACDMAIEDILKGKKHRGGFNFENIISIDHHAPHKRMEKHISSTNLAIKYVRKYGIRNKANDQIVINHTDCDSVLSSAIVKGILLPEARFGKAAIAADHTGKKNKIADLLQSLRGKRDLEFSLRNLELLLKKCALEPEAQNLLNKRLRNRTMASRLIKENKFNRIGNIYYAILNEKNENEFFRDLLPEATIIMIAHPLKANPKKWEIHLGLGTNVIDGYRIDNKLIAQKIDKNYGGRWNAGADNRSCDGNPAHGGTDIHPQKYAKKLSKILDI